MIRVLVVGGGAREHALLWACHQSALAPRLLCAPGNAGTATLATSLPIAADDVGSLVAAVDEHGIELVVLGPEAAIAAGVGDALAERGVACFGPSAAAGRIESSKVHAKRLMEQAAIPTAAWTAGGAGDRERLLGFVRERGGACVVKADGLAQGKGVTVCASEAAAVAAVDACLGGRFGSAGTTVLVEERLEGREVSVLALTDGDAVRVLPAACDYKRAGEGDTGPNTGGMGAYAPPLHLDPDGLLDDAVAQVLQPAVDALRAAGTPYRGCLYAGLMVTREGLRVLEFNARLGDPEAQVVLPLVAEDVLELLGACAVGGVGAGRVRVHRGAAVGVVLASAGYPGPHTTGHVVEGLDVHDRHGGHVFHAGTRRAPDGSIVTAGGRVVTVVGRGADHAEARRRAYERAGAIRFEGMTMRADIAAA